MITRVEAICLLVSNLISSRDYYENKLGLTVSLTDTGFVEYKLGDTPLAIFERKHATAMFPSKFMSRPGGAVIALKVSDVHKLCKNLEEKGVTPFEGPKKVPWGQTVAYIHDPDGHIIELTD